MNLAVTGIGRYVDEESTKEKGLLILNKGEIILLVDDKELLKVIPFFKPKVNKTTIEKPTDNFYVDSSYVTDEEANKFASNSEEEVYEEAEVLDESEYYEDQELDEDIEEFK